MSSGTRRSPRRSIASRPARCARGWGGCGPWIGKTLEAFYVHGQSLIEMSNAFGSPIGTIKRRLHVARKRLARELEELAPA